MRLRDIACQEGYTPGAMNRRLVALCAAGALIAIFLFGAIFGEEDAKPKEIPSAVVFQLISGQAPARVAPWSESSCEYAWSTDSLIHAQCGSLSFLVSPSLGTVVPADEGTKRLWDYSDKRGR